MHKPINVGRWVAGAVMMLASGLAAVSAAPAIQQPVIVGAEQPVMGTLDGAAPQAAYVFDCQQGGVFSAHVETTSGDLIVEIAVFDPGAQRLMTGQIEQKSPNISVAEAFVSPVNGLCAIELSRVGETAGTYALRVLPGYAKLDKWETFDQAGPPLGMKWPVELSDEVSIAVSDQQLDMMVMIEGRYGFALPEDEGLNWSDVYVQADFVIDGDPSYHEYGFLLRANDPPNVFYLLTVSSDGDWSYYFYDNGWHELQPWTVHPAIDGGDKQPTLGVWLRGQTLTLYFNGRYVGEVSDPNGIKSDGLVGLVAATNTGQSDILTVHADNLVITRPFGSSSVTALPFGTAQQATPTPGALFGLGNLTKTPQAGPLVPTLPPLVVPVLPTETPMPQGETLLNWDSATPQDIVRELQSYGVVPAGGSVALTVPSSYGDTSSSGFNYYALGQGRSFHNFVLTFDARLDAGSMDAGCGMHFRANDSSTSLSMVFPNGSVYLAQWLDAGDTHAASIYGEHRAVTRGLGATNRVTIVARDSLLSMYVNGEQVAQDTFNNATGALALEVYVAEDDTGRTQRTYCQLDRIWLWEF